MITSVQVFVQVRGTRTCSSDRGAADTAGVIDSNVMTATTPFGPAMAAPMATFDGSETSATALYDSYGTLAFTLAYRIVGDRGVAEDVVQDAFLAMWRSAARYDGARGSVRTWLCQIVRNRALDRLRGTSRRARQHVSLDELTGLVAPDDVFDDVVERDAARRVAVAVAALPHGQREAIELAYYAGCSQAEIAGRTGLPLGTIKGRTRAAMRTLATALAELRPLPEVRPNADGTGAQAARC